MKDYLLVILFICSIILYSFLLGALATWLLSLAFGFTFTWLKAFCFWLAFTFIIGGIRITFKK